MTFALSRAVKIVRGLRQGLTETERRLRFFSPPEF
jgi:hypothetical protein